MSGLDSGRPEEAASECEAIEVDGAEEEVPSFSFKEEAGECDSEDAETDSRPSPLVLHPALLETRRRLLCGLYEASHDAVCALSVAPAVSKNGRLFAAAGTCDDVCSVFDVSFALTPEDSESVARLARNEKEEDEPPPSLPGTCLPGALDSVSCVAFSNDGTLLAAGSFDGACRVYRLLEDEKEEEREREFGRSGKEKGDSAREGRSVKAGLLGVLRGSNGGVSDLKFHPKGAALLAATEDGTSWLWILPPLWMKEAGREAAERSFLAARDVFFKNELPSSPESLSNAEESLLKAAGLPTEATVFSVFVGPSPLTTCEFGGVASQCVVGTQCGTVCLYTARDGKAVFTFKHPLKEPLARAVWGGSSSNVSLAAASSFFQKDKSSYYCDEEQEEGDGRGVVCLAVDTERRSVSVGYEDGCLMVFSEENKKPLFAALAHEGAVESISQLSKSHPLVAAACGGGIANSNSERSFPHWVVSCGMDGFVKVWCVSRRSVKIQIDCRALPETSLSSTVAPSASETSERQTEGRAAEAGGRGGRGEEGEGATRIRIHPSLPLVAVSSSWGICRICDLQSRQVLTCWSAHGSAVMDLETVAANRNFWILLSGDAEGSVAMWKLDTRHFAPSLF